MNHKKYLSHLELCSGVNSWGAATVFPIQISNCAHWRILYALVKISETMWEQFTRLYAPSVFTVLIG